MRRLHGHALAALVGRVHEGGQQGGAVGAAIIRQRAQQVAGEAVGEVLDDLREAVAPLLERMVTALELRYFPMRVDIDDEHGRLPTSSRSAPSVAKRVEVRVEFGLSALLLARVARMDDGWSQLLSPR